MTHEFMHNDQVPLTTDPHKPCGRVKETLLSVGQLLLQSTEAKLQTISTEQKDSFCAKRSRIVQIPPVVAEG